MPLSKPPIMPKRFYAAGETRRAQIVASGIVVLERDGYAALTVRNVAAETGISSATVQHHFPHKSLLVEAVARRSVEVFEVAIDKILEQPTSATSKLEKVLQHIFKENRKARTANTFFELWAMANRESSARSALERGHRFLHNMFKVLLAEINPGIEMETVSHRAMILVAVCDGLMISIGYNGSMQNCNAPPDYDELIAMQIEFATT